MFAPIDMTGYYKNEYDWGWINKATLQQYVQMGILSAAGYKEITGDAYATTAPGVV